MGRKDYPIYIHILWKIKAMFETTNQYISLTIINHY